MTAPIIIPTGGITGAGTAGISKTFDLDETVTFTASDAVSGTFFTQLISAPPTQTSTIQDGSTSSPSLTLDAAGTYRIRMTRDGEVAEILIAVLTPEGYRLPGYDEKNNANAVPPEAVWNLGGNTQGYYPDTHALLAVAGTAAESGAPANWVLLETITVTGSPSTGVTFSGLTGDTTERYRLEFEMPPPGTITGDSTTVRVLPNASTSDCHGWRKWDAVGGAFNGDAGNPYWETTTLVDAAFANRKTSCHMDIVVRSGFPRYYQGVAVVSDDAGGSFFFFSLNGLWTDEATELTSLYIGTTDGNASMPVGSTFRLYSKVLG